MNAEALFTAALQLGPEWKVVRCEVDHSGQELTVHLNFLPGSRFPVPEAARQLLCPVHDTVVKRWRHLNFWQYRTTITARVPRIETPEGEVVLLQAVKKARLRSRVTRRRVQLLLVAPLRPFRITLPRRCHRLRYPLALPGATVCHLEIVGWTCWDGPPSPF